MRCQLASVFLCWDDELPDYVMVMVANRKSEAQMCDDLSLFLGSNTSKFTAWWVVSACLWRLKVNYFHFLTASSDDISYFWHCTLRVLFVHCCCSVYVSYFRLHGLLQKLLSITSGQHEIFHLFIWLDICSVLFRKLFRVFDHCNNLH